MNGAGLLLTTEECLLSKVQERNPPFSREDYEAVFAEYLGVKKVLWLHRGIVGDDTHGHIDDLARFVSASTVVTVIESNPSDENYALLQENRERLEAMTDQHGSRLNVGAFTDATAVDLRRRAFACELRELLHCERRGDCADVQRPGRTAWPSATLAELFPDRGGDRD